MELERLRQLTRDLLAAGGDSPAFDTESLARTLFSLAPGPWRFDGIDVFDADDALHIRCGTKEVEVRGAADPHVLAATINQQLARIRTS